jgi:hypothetical protein
VLRRSTTEVTRAVRGHPVLVAVLVAAALVRLAAAVTYAPALMWTDSWQYVYATHLPGDFAPEKPNGYMLLLELFGTRLGLVTAVQHLLGLAGAVLMYAILRRLGCRPLLAAAATGVVALDAYAIALEQYVLAEAAFTATLVCWAAVVVLLGPGPGPTALAGALLVAATTLRAVALFVIPVWVVYAVWRERGWLARALAIGVPVVALGLYGTWHDAATGGLGLTQMDGWMLYGRTAEIGGCNGRTVPARDKPLCPPASSRLAGWNDDPYAYSLYSAESPMQRAVGNLYSLPADQRRVANARLRAFARDVIHDRPFAFARIVARDTAKYFVPGTMSRLKGFDEPITFPERSRGVPAVARSVQRSYAPGYTAPPDGRARILPFYQRWVHTPRWLLAALVVASLVALATRVWPGGARRRQLAHLGEIALLTGAGLALVVGAALNHFEVRYVIPAVPLLVMGGTVAVSELVAASAPRRAPAAEREVPLAAA